MKLPEAIYCKTKEESRKIREILHKNNFTWSNGNTLLDETNPVTPTENITYTLTYPSHVRFIRGKPTIETPVPAAEVIRQHKSEVESILTPGSMVKAVKENWKTDIYHKGRLVGFTRDGSPVVEDRTGGIGIYDGVEPYNEKEENLKMVKDLMADLGITKEDL